MNNLIIAFNQADRIEQMLIDAGGELTPELEQELAINPKTIGELVDTKYVMLERMDSSIELFEKKAEEFAKVAASLKSAKKFINDSIKDFMIQNDKKEIAGTDYTFKLAGAAPKVEIVDESKIVDVYKVTKTEVRIDLKKIGDELKSGIPVDGAVLKENYSLRKSIKKGGK